MLGRIIGATWLWVPLVVGLGDSSGFWPESLIVSSIIGPVLGEPSFLQAMSLVDSSGIPSAKQNQLIGAINGVFQVKSRKSYIPFLVQLTNYAHTGWRFHWHSHD